MTRGKFFFFNLILIFILSYYTIPLFSYESNYPFIYKYSLYYLIFLTFNICIVVFYLFACVITKNNRFLFYFVIISILTLEIVMRIVGQSPQGTKFKYSVPHIMWVNEPNSEYMIQSEGQELPIKINELGYRGDVPKKIKNGEYRIIMIGASTVLNRESIMSKTLPGLIQDKFINNGHKQVRIYNWGVSAYKSEQELITILEKAVNFSPDLILVYNGGNDIHESYNYDPRIGYPFNYMAYELGYSRMGNNLNPLQFIELILQQSKVLQFLHGRNKFRFINIDKLRRNASFNSKEWKEDIANNYIDNINKMLKLSNSFNFKILVVLQPMLHNKNILTDVEKEKLGRENFRVYVKKMYKVISNKFNSLSNNYVDMDTQRLLDIHQIFSSESKTIYRDIIHINDYGREMIADTVFKELTTLMSR